jgi:hypothetical protein
VARLALLDRVGLVQGQADGTHASFAYVSLQVEVRPESEQFRTGTGSLGGGEDATTPGGRVPSGLDQYGFGYQSEQRAPPWLTSGFPDEHAKGLQDTPGGGLFGVDLEPDGQL